MSYCDRCAELGKQVATLEADLQRANERIATLGLHLNAETEVHEQITKALEAAIEKQQADLQRVREAANVVAWRAKNLQQFLGDNWKNRYIPPEIKWLIEAALAQALESTGAPSRSQVPAISEGEYKSRIDCLSMFVRRLYRKLRKHEPDAEVIQQANTYLKAIGQAGTPMRAEECESTGAPEGQTK